MRNNLLTEKLVYTGISDTPTHLHLCSYSGTEICETSEQTFQAVTDKLGNQQIHWLQVHGLKETEKIREICTHFDISFLTLQDILNVKHPTKIEESEQHIVLILKLFHFESANNELEQQQVGLVLGENYVLTFLENETTFFDDITEAIQKNVLKIRGRQADYLASVLLNSVIGNYITTITHIEEQLEDLEEKMLSITNNNDIGIEIQTLRRQYMIMKKAILPLKEQYIKLLRSESSLFHKANRAFFNDTNDHLQFVLQTIEICRETLSSLVDLYISNNDLRMNNIMKRLTVVSTIFIPLTFLVGVWGMNFKQMPELEWGYGYLFAWILMVLIGIIVYLYFKKKKWY